MHALALKLKTVRPEIWAFTLALLVVNGSLFAGRVCSAFVFSPDQVGAGEWWRAVTFPLVHVSLYHLLLDASAFLMLYQGLQEPSTKRRILYVLACAAGSLGFSLLTSRLGGGLCGLSGIAHGLMAVTGLELMCSTDRALRNTGLICFALTLIKSLFEAATGQIAFSFLHLGSVGIPVAACHLGGVIGGGSAFLFFRRFPSQSGNNMQAGANILMKYRRKVLP
jgi:rhomboid family GlyGly-CTERM serine protease